MVKTGLSKALSAPKLIPKGIPAEGYPAGKSFFIVDIWTVLFLTALMAGIMGWCITPFLNGVIWFCDWKDGNPINWGLETAFTLAVPFAWMFALFEIIILYHR